MLSALVSITDCTLNLQVAAFVQTKKMPDAEQASAKNLSTSEQVQLVQDDDGPQLMDTDKPELKPDDRAVPEQASGSAAPTPEPGATSTPLDGSEYAPSSGGTVATAPEPAEASGEQQSVM
jgi:hypothetical protein